MDAKSLGSIKKSGFTLIELLIVFIIVGLLAAIAIPIYRANIKKVASSEGAALLGSILTAQKVYFSENGTYTADKNILGIDLSGSKYFKEFELIHANGNGFIAKTIGSGICEGVELIMEYTNVAGATISYSGL